MSAGILREAAAEMRFDARLFSDQDAEFHHAVADWLDSEAARVERGKSSITFEGAPMFPPAPEALAVARAYMGTDS